jgi:hypothetical protein
VDLGGVMGLIFSCGCSLGVVVEDRAVWRWFRRHWLHRLCYLSCRYVTYELLAMLFLVSLY